MSRVTYHVSSAKCHVPSVRWGAVTCKLANLQTCKLSHLPTFTLANLPPSRPLRSLERLRRELPPVSCRARVAVCALRLPVGFRRCTFLRLSLWGCYAIVGVIIVKSANVSRRNQPPAATTSSARASTSEARCPTRRITSRSSSVNGSPLRVLTTSSAPRRRSPSRSGIAISERV